MLPDRQVKWGRWVMMGYREQRGNPDHKEYQDLLASEDPLASGDQKAREVPGVLMAL